MMILDSGLLFIGPPCRSFAADLAHPKIWHGPDS